MYVKMRGMHHLNAFIFVCFERPDTHYTHLMFRLPILLGKLSWLPIIMNNSPSITHLVNQLYAVSAVYAIMLIYCALTEQNVEANRLMRR